MISCFVLFFFTCAALEGEGEIKKEEASMDEISWPWNKKVGSSKGGLKVCFWGSLMHAFIASECHQRASQSVILPLRVIVG